MSEVTTDRALAGNEEEEEVLPPEPTTRSIILGEVVGSFLLSVLGLGIGVSATLWGAPGAPCFPDIWPTAAGWALAIALGIYVTATLSGAHFNPAVTITMAVTGRHPWRLVPLYILCQVIGWFLGAAVLMAMFGRNLFDFAASKNIDIGSPASTGLAAAFTTYSPNPGISGAAPGGFTTVSFLEGLAGEILGTAILLLVILSLLETRHVNAPSAWFFPLIVGATIGLLIMFIAPISQASFNPARDLGPRIMLLLVGFGSVAFPGPNHGLSLIATTIGPIIGGIIGALFFDKVMRPNIPGHEVEGSHVTTLSQLAYDPTMEVRSETLHGHAARLPLELVGADHVDLVMVDAGGCIYDDDSWALAVLNAARQLAPGDGIDETEFWSIYDAQRQAQGGSLSRTVATRFLPSGDPEELNQLARSQFQVPAASIYPDARPTLAALATRYKLGVVANPSEQHIAALKRDGLMQYFDVVVHPEQVDLAKTPSPRMWKRALEETGVQANRAVHVGNRIDNDIRPAKQAGLHTIWLLRGEAPPSPTVEQLAEADAIVTTFSGVPNALVAISPSSIAATA
jgi:MIP family channel proteins/HAD superfamily hydrolase (TIGR01509 family)